MILNISKRKFYINFHCIYFLNLNLNIKIEYIIINANTGIDAIPILLNGIFETNLIVVSDKIIINSPIKKVKILSLR